MKKANMRNRTTSKIKNICISVILLTTSLQSLVFQDWIDAVGLVKMEIIIRDNSTIDINYALEIIRTRVNDTANKAEFDGIDVKASLSDFRNGNIYEVFSDNWMTKYNQTSFWNLQLDNVAIQELLNRVDTPSGNVVLPDNVMFGYSDNVTASGIDCRYDVSFLNPENNNYTVIHSLVNRNNNYVTISESTSTSFTLKIIDTSSIIEKSFNCLTDGVQELNYAIIFR